ncbi:MAG TPA: protein kinase [Holophagaceae bacterium]|nr:protein kinase [Holophagaceae bacterium]
MTLRQGVPLGPYEIMAPIGAGGMGEVYKAKDPRLDRLVAIKVLPEHLAKHPESLARFEREARAVAALNHPNITGIFDLGNEGDTVYAVMELLEGETLRDRLKSGPLSPRLATELAIQLAQGLAAAHEKGVVHRDLKPENLWITTEGRLKILDFGLAKQLPTFTASGASALPTEAMEAGPHTEKGMILGTLGYMSPEQVRGETVDARSDLFSFGAVLFELLTGRRPFARDTASDTMAAILRDDPPDVQDGSRPIPPGLRRIVDHCLEKLPARRFRDAQDLAFALENLSNASEGAAPSAAAPPSPPPPPRRRLGASLAAMAVLGAGLAGWLLRGGPAPLPTFRPLTLERGTLSAARFLPSATEVIYSARWAGQAERWYTRKLDQAGVQTIPGGEGPILSVTREGEVLALAEAFLTHGQLSGRLFSLPMVGGSPREWTEGAWGCDQGERAGDVACILGSYGGDIRIEWPLGRPIYHCLNALRAPRIQGDHLAVFQEKQGNVEEGVLQLIDRKGTVRELGALRGFTGLAWGPGGEEVWVSTYQRGESRILALDLKGRQRTLLQHAGRLELQDVDARGRVLAALHTYQRQTFARIEGESVDRDLGWLEAQATMGISADGTSALLANLGEWSLSEGSLYLRPLAGGPAQRMGMDGLRQPNLSPDGKWLSSFTTDPEFSLVIAPTGPGATRRFPLPGMENGDIGAYFIPGAQQALIWGSINRGAFAGYLLDLGTGKTRQITRTGISTFLFQSPCSPDGQWLALFDGTQSAHGVNPIVVMHPDGTGERTYTWLKRGEAISAWGADSASLIVWDRNRIPAAVVRVELATGRRTPVAQLMPTDPAGVPGIQGFFPSRDGRRYAYNLVRKLSQLYTIEGLK